MRIVARAMQLVLSKPPVTTHQLAMLAKDNVTAVDAVQAQFGFEPRRLPDALSYIRA
jgi:NADH dehydrogenase